MGAREHSSSEKKICFLRVCSKFHHPPCAVRILFYFPSGKRHKKEEARSSSCCDFLKAIDVRQKSDERCCWGNANMGNKVECILRLGHDGVCFDGKWRVNGVYWRVIMAFHGKKAVNILKKYLILSSIGLKWSKTLKV